jgi:hypothetical protein
MLNRNSGELCPHCGENEHNLTGEDHVCPLGTSFQLELRSFMADTFLDWLLMRNAVPHAGDAFA